MKSVRIKKMVSPYLLILPAIVLIILFKIYPIINTLLESILVEGKITFNNFKELFADKYFLDSLWVTIKFNVILTPVQVFLSLLVSLLVNANVKGIGAFRTIYYLPATMSTAVAAIIWATMLNPNNGVLNSIISLFGIAKQPFLTSDKQALFCIMLITTWIGVGYWMMFILAGLKSIDESVYDSAKMDGANWLQTTVKITIPMIRKTLAFVIISDTTINLLMFAPMQIITNGGPNRSTSVLMYEAYKAYFTYADKGRGDAIVSVLLLIIGIVVCIQYFLINGSDNKPKKNRRGNRF